MNNRVVISTSDSKIRTSMDNWLRSNCQSKHTAGMPPYSVLHFDYWTVYLDFDYTEDAIAFKLKFGV